MKVSAYMCDENYDPIPTYDFDTWATWFEKADRTIMLYQIGESRISTVFLGVDHGFMSDVPVLFETMVFGGPMDQNQRRYSTVDDARKGHSEMVELVKEASK